MAKGNFFLGGNAGSTQHYRVTPERRQELDRLLEQALELEPAQRAAFVKTACKADSDLRQKLESLLTAHDQASHFLETSALEVAAREMSGGEQDSLIGRKLGHCEILSMLGEGGMGRVYLAHDTILRRNVALKLLPPEYADPSTLRRFEEEAHVARSSVTRIRPPPAARLTKRS